MYILPVFLPIRLIGMLGDIFHAVGKVNFPRESLSSIRDLERAAIPPLIQLRAANNTPCTYCGRPTTDEQGTDKLNGDHIVPLSKGGNNSPENYAQSCRACNLQKDAEMVLKVWRKGELQFP